MAWWPVIASVAGSLISSMGTKDTNNTNQQIQENNSAFNAEQAAINREWSSNEALANRTFQSQTADTVWQRGVTDMKAAGLNPMLAYSQGGNPAPQGAMGQSSAAQAGAPGNMQNAFANAGQSALNWAQIENVQAQTDKTKAEADNERARLPGYQGSGQLNDAMVANLRANTTNALAQADLAANQKEKVIAEVNKVIAEEKNIDQDTLLKKVNTILQNHDVPRMKAEEAYFKSPVGKESPHNKYGPQTPFRMMEGLGERVINRFNAPRPNDDATTRSPW